jgi:outer membrane lipoprotein-sorting protein
MNNILSRKPEMTRNNNHGYFFPGFAIAICLSIAFLIEPLSAADMPSPIKNHYRDRGSVYWKIKQVTYSPVFEHSETLAVEFFIERPNKIYAVMPDKRLFFDGETTWVYLPEDKQIQKSINGDFFNPFDLIDSAQTRFQIHSVSPSRREFVMLSIDEIMEPDSLTVRYDSDGGLKEAGYVDTNDNRITLLFIKESFNKKIPTDIFAVKPPKDVEIINLDE